MASFSISGQFFEPRSSRGHRGRLAGGPGRLMLIEDEAEPKDAISVQLEAMQGRRDVYFTCGRYFHADADLPADFRAAFQSRRAAARSWLEVASPLRLVALVAIVVLALGVIRVLFFNFADAVVTVFPRDWEAAIGAQAYAGFEPLQGNPSQIDPAYRAYFRAETERMAAAAGIAPVPALYFHDAEAIGINAMAFPGGPLVVTDQLVAVMQADEVLAVIAHELAHVEARHSLHQIIEVSGLAIMATLFLGAEEAIIDNLASIGITLWGFRNSRAFERDADTRAAEILALSGRDAAALARALTVLQEKACEARGLEPDACGHAIGHGWLSTHPSTAERIERLNAGRP